MCTVNEKHFKTKFLLNCSSYILEGITKVMKANFDKYPSLEFVGSLDVPDFISFFLNNVDVLLIYPEKITILFALLNDKDQ